MMTKNEDIKGAIIELVRGSGHILNPMEQKAMIGWLKKQNAPASDNPKPKFKAGDWVITDYDNFELKYKSALGTATTMYACAKESNDKEMIQSLELIFPELKKSKDELIREEILNCFVEMKKQGCFPSKHGEQYDSWISWLKKQGNTDLEFFENGENEKREFVGYGFLKCKGDFLSFKEGETYWLEYVGKDNYSVRSDNLLGQTFHITPQQLYTVFRPTTWLEKQGKQNPTNSEDESIRKYILNFIELNKGVNLPPDDADKMNAWLEKQGEQKITRPVWKYKKDNTPLLRDSFILNKYGCVAESPSGALVSDVWVLDFDELSKLPKEEIERHIDKVEPKFKVGDWIINSEGTLRHILAVGRTGYETNEGWLTHDIYEMGFHLWTIQDAKDGDVLATSAGAFIYNGSNGGGSCPGCYCAINTLGRFQTGVEHHWTGKKVYPATKEERDILFQKIKEAGYKWDGEKRELNKIE